MKLRLLVVAIACTCFVVSDEEPVAPVAAAVAAAAAAPNVEAEVVAPKEEPSDTTVAKTTKVMIGD